ncbi:ImpE protein [Planctomycetes bacterium Pan216]|uniref:ImpE protein n=1 Tax=Kolteria novifilia TaxID=2527975 RepID=A0A518B616_9BACT|nr:ImpE protein [Planctomycetes bacterium Pan216]
MTAKEAFEAGNLTGAIDACGQEVKANPTDSGKRAFLCELLAFAGNLERADKNLEALANVDPETMVAVMLFRHLIRAAQSREQFHTEGRLPEFLTEPGPLVQAYLRASILVREGEFTQAGELLEEQSESFPVIRGTCDGEPFEGLRDLDDLCAPILEVLTSTGKYYWVPLEQIEELSFDPPETLRDLLWRPARLNVAHGPDGVVYIPAIYPGTRNNEDDRLKLGRATDWTNREGGLVQGVGQRSFLVGDKDVPILELKELTIGEPSSS